jgi:hypothetical protein
MQGMSLDSHLVGGNSRYRIRQFGSPTFDNYDGVSRVRDLHLPLRPWDWNIEPTA